MSHHLHILALNLPSETRHTHLTRQQGEAPDLPPLAAWLKLPHLDTNQIELFPISDLAGMPLSAYLTAAFDVEEAALAGEAKRLDALGGSVLLVPSAASDAAPNPGAEATLIASLPLARPDHSAELPPADVRPNPSPEPPPPDAPAASPIGSATVGLVLAALLVLLIWWLT